MIKGFRNANIYVEGKGISKQSLLIEDGKIQAIGDFDDSGLLSLDDELILVPGFINKHIHGANNSDCMYPTYRDIANIAIVLTQDGVTSFLATTMTQSKNNIDLALDNIRKYIEKPALGATLLGVHLEGPFISIIMKGAQPIEYILPCNVALLDHYQKISGNNIKQVSFAYEESGEAFLDYLVKNNIVASLGHTNATSDEVLEAAAHGASSATHMFNAMKGFHHREAGTVGGLLLAENINCELICDLFHVSKNAIKLLYKCKGNANISLITDSIEASHLPDGKYLLGGHDVYVNNSEARLKDGTIAGSTLRMNIGVKNMKTILDLTLEEALNLATINPARVLKIDDKKGSIKVGKDADLIVIDKDFNVYLTIVNGITVYHKEGYFMENQK